MAVLSQASATATATATIVSPIAIYKTGDMDFGSVGVSPVAAGVVTLAPDGSRSATGGITLPVAAELAKTASFTITGEPGYVFSITLPASPLIITRQGGDETMKVDGWMSLPSKAGTLLNGMQTLTIGATLHVGAGQRPGTYENRKGFTVMVSYN